MSAAKQPSRRPPTGAAPPGAARLRTGRDMWEAFKGRGIPAEGDECWVALWHSFGETCWRTFGSREEAEEWSAAGRGGHIICQVTAAGRTPRTRTRRPYDR